VPRSRLSLPLALLCALLAVAAAVPVAARAQDRFTLSRQLARQMGRAGAYSGAYVLDLATGRPLFSWRAGTARSPASIEKLYTTSTALLRMGPQATLDTTVLGAGALDETGTWQGDLYLKGGGDPSLSKAGIAAIAQQLETAGIVRVTGSVYGDESLFDAARGSFDTNLAYDPDIVGVLGALTVDRGFATKTPPALAAARDLVRDLRADGVRVIGRTGTGTAPLLATTLATLASPPLGELIAETNQPSDNFYAETLAKVLGARFGGAGTTAAGAQVIAAQMAALGLRPRVVDGSGLSRTDHTSPREVVHLLAHMQRTPLARVFEASLPVAGRTGTLRHRMRGSTAQNRCHAKTGSLIGVSSLAGLCSAAGGHTVAFAILMNGVGQLSAHHEQDRMAAAIARYSGS
jgi:serine-type D-Ala-D-Ala carboxypeptidase/endopeptidase (penicillin-binding protein 4)